MRKIIFLILILSFGNCLAYAQGVQELENATIKVASRVGKAVVSISTVTKEKVGLNFDLPFNQDDPFSRFFDDFLWGGAIPDKEYTRRGLGSGVILDKKGYILTNEHVVSGANEIKVKLSDGREFDAEIKGSDQRSDLAVIKIKAKKLPVAELGNSNNLRIGQWVTAIGNPFGAYIDNPEPTVTVGVVSALHRYLPGLGGAKKRSYDDLIQTDAAINPGNSGGPLVNLRGEVVGINTAIISISGGYQGLGFAIPINNAKRILDKLIKGEKVLYGWLGVNIQNLNEDLRNYFGVDKKEGVIVLKVYEESPAEKAGIKEGDLILSFGNQSVRTTHDLVKMISSLEVGKKVPIKIVRSGKILTLNARIGRMPKDADFVDNSDDESTISFRGMKVDDLTQSLRRRFSISEKSPGVVVTEIKSGSAADKSGLPIGSLILAVERKRVKNKKQFKAITSKIKGNCLLKTNQGYFVLKNK